MTHHAKHRIEGLKLCDCCHPDGRKNRRRKVRAWLRKQKRLALKEQTALL
jgi:hypothetical protein